MSPNFQVQAQHPPAQLPQGPHEGLVIWLWRVRKLQIPWNFLEICGDSFTLQWEKIETQISCLVVWDLGY